MKDTCFTMSAALSHISESIVGQEGATMVKFDRNKYNISFSTLGTQIWGFVYMLCFYFGYMQKLACSQQTAWSLSLVKHPSCRLVLGKHPLCCLHGPGFDPYLNINKGCLLAHQGKYSKNNQIVNFIGPWEQLSKI